MPEEIVSTASFFILHLHTIMNVTDHWPMAREYSVWNTRVATL